MAKRVKPSELIWEPKSKTCGKCGITMAFTYVFNQQHYLADKAKAECEYRAWKYCQNCAAAKQREMANDKTLHRQFEAFRKLDAKEQRRRATLGLFEDFPDELR